ncbi:MAG: penicillin-binding transpeptidase domain-containing protein [Oscillospiraceae bacterium]
MRTTGFRSVVLYILLAFFLGGIGYFTVNLVLNGEKWVVQPYNGHIYADDATADTGRITDRNNILLAESQEGKRIYSENSDIRRGLLHTVGDSSGYIGTSVQAELRSQLMGYNIFTGLNRTPLTAIGTNNMKLTVDAPLSAAAYEGLGGKNGAVLLYNYHTGEVLCKVSAPTYDPMEVPEDLSENPEYEGVFVDNTISSAFVPGSIFKLVTAACAMENLSDWQELTFDCGGEVELGNGVITCLGTHGTQDISEALGNSCNVYFSLLAEKLGNEKLQATAEEMGFNKSFSFSDFSTAPSKIDLTTANALERGWAGVGQFTVTANPTHMLVLMGAIANGGKITPPRITEKGIFSAPQKEELLVLEEMDQPKHLQEELHHLYF